MQNKQSKLKTLGYHETDKRKVLSSGVIIALVIITSPLLFYAYQGFPDDSSWESFFGTYHSQYYKSTQTFFWVLFGKLVPTILLFVWFFTCKHWWYHAILVPIAMYIFQVYSIITEDSLIDSNEILYIIPIIAIVAALSYTIRTKIFDRLYGVDLDQEFKRVRWNGKIVKIPADSPLDIPEVGDDEIDD